MRSQPTRLELHRLKFNRDNRMGELLRFDELDQSEHELLSAAFFSEVRKDPDRDPYQLYSEVLADWGVMCHHPQSKRLYNGDTRSELPSYIYRWFHCECCQTDVINIVTNSPTYAQIFGDR